MPFAIDVAKMKHFTIRYNKIMGNSRDFRVAAWDVYSKNNKKNHNLDFSDFIYLESLLSFKKIHCKNQKNAKNFNYLYYSSFHLFSIALLLWSLKHASFSSPFLPLHTLHSSSILFEIQISVCVNPELYKHENTLVNLSHTIPSLQSFQFRDEKKIFCVYVTSF